MEKLLAEQARLQDAIEAIGGWELDRTVEIAMDALRVPPGDQDVPTLSGGERAASRSRGSCSSEPEVLLLDEPTNHLDAVAPGSRTGSSRPTATLCMVTHDRYFLDRVVDRIVELDRGKLVSYSGQLHRLPRRARGARRGRAPRRPGAPQTLRRETAWIRRGPPAQRQEVEGAALAVRRRSSTRSRSGRHRELELEIPPGPRLGDARHPLKAPGSRSAAASIVPPLDLEIGPGECVGVAGPNGAGKSTFLALCTGALAPDRGEVLVGETVKIATIDQKRSELDPAKTVLEEVAGKSTTMLVGERTMRVESFLERFLFPGDRKHQKVAELSGGERNRILLAKLLGKGGNVLVLDEPTNDLDVATLRVLEDAIARFEGTVLVVSHDRWFLDRVATRIVFFEGRGTGGLVRRELRRLRGGPEEAPRRRSRSAPPPALQAAQVGAVRLHRSGLPRRSPRPSSGAVPRRSPSTAWAPRHRRVPPGRRLLEQRGGCPPRSGRRRQSRSCR